MSTLRDCRNYADAMGAPVDIDALWPYRVEQDRILEKISEVHDFLGDTGFARIILHYSAWQPAYKQLGSNVEFCEGLPTDLMRESSGVVAMANLFTKGSYHHSLSVIFITHDLFHKVQRVISLNAQYIGLFRNMRQRAQIQHLLRQMCPEKTKFLQEIF